MKILLTKLLLALTLAINPLSVLAENFHHHYEMEADTECATQEVCTGQQHSVFTSPIPLIFSHSNRNRGWSAHVFDVPERELPPEPRPPIHI